MLTLKNDDYDTSGEGMAGMNVVMWDPDSATNNSWYESLKWTLKQEN